MPRHYLDNAATSFPKPPEVAQAVTEYLQNSGAPAGRGAYREATEVARIIERCRQSAANLFGAPDPRRIIFTFNGTDGLNLAILGICQPGDHVITSTWEHNSVLRPLRMLQETHGVDVTWLEPDDSWRIDPQQVAAAWKSQTRLVAIQHANNVIGVLQPIEDIGKIVREREGIFLVDAAQSAGQVPINVASQAIDLLACPGHKGLLGPLGTGLLYVGERVSEELLPLRYGGTGTHSEEDRQPAELPEKFESGNLNVPGIVGLDAGLHWLTQQGLSRVHQREQALLQTLWDGFSALPHVTLYGSPPATVGRTGVVSLNVQGYDQQDAALILDEHFGVQGRAGLHCAPGVHRSLGTLSSGGTLRLSVGALTTVEDVQAAVTALMSLG
ncbi:aminotransferase class V-fold PLP-dependent enzyme [bacterium]|nr:aminotransferase class V-fold PLP-dependent enzyme [bacterium]